MSGPGPRVGIAAKSAAMHRQQLPQRPGQTSAVASSCSSTARAKLVRAMSSRIGGRQRRSSAQRHPGRERHAVDQVACVVTQPAVPHRRRTGRHRCRRKPQSPCGSHSSASCTGPAAAWKPRNPQGSAANCNRSARNRLRAVAVRSVRARAASRAGRTAVRFGRAVRQAHPVEQCGQVSRGLRVQRRRIGQQLVPRRPRPAASARALASSHAGSCVAP